MLGECFVATGYLPLSYAVATHAFRSLVLLWHAPRNHRKMKPNAAVSVSTPAFYHGGWGGERIPTVKHVELEARFRGALESCRGCGGSRCATDRPLVIKSAISQCCKLILCSVRRILPWLLFETQRISSCVALRRRHSRSFTRRYTS